MCGTQKRSQRRLFLSHKRRATSPHRRLTCPPCIRNLTHCSFEAQRLRGGWSGGFDPFGAGCWNGYWTTCGVHHRELNSFLASARLRLRVVVPDIARSCAFHYISPDHQADPRGSGQSFAKTEVRTRIPDAAAMRGVYNSGKHVHARCLFSRKRNDRCHFEKRKSKPGQILQRPPQGRAVRHTKRHAPCRALQHGS